MGFSGETAVFIGTTLGTSLAFSVPPGIISGDLKSKLGREHSSCFPNLGEIIVNALMVKRKSYLYHLPDSMPIKNACQGFGSWFVFVDASQVHIMPREMMIIQHLSSCNDAAVEVLSVPNLNEKERRTRGQKNTKCAVCGDGYLQDTVIRKCTSTEGMNRPECTSGFNSEENQGKYSIINELPVAEGSDEDLVLQHPLENERQKSSLMSESDSPTVIRSARASVTSIISKYFPDFTETSFENRPSEDNQKIGKTDQIEIVCSTRKTTKSSVDHTFVKKQNGSDSNSACSANIISSDEKKKLYTLGKRCRRPEKNKIASPGEQQAMCTVMKMKKITGSADSDFERYQADDKLDIGGPKTRANEKVFPVVPSCASKMFSTPLPLPRKGKALNSKIDRFKVGKRLVQAANNFGFSECEKTEEIHLHS